MASGLPVITTTTCGAAEWLTPQTGWVVPPTDAVALQQALAEACALSHVALHERGAQARALVTPCSLERFGQELQALYERLLA
jgi:UDP-glucose:(heptosyl)LPS alpha-1,3-glucosyltransferase